MRSYAQHRREQAILALACSQHGVISLPQLVDLGLSARTAQQRVKDGRLFRIYRTVYSLVPRELLTRNGLYMAAVLACGPGAVISHRSAAVLHQLRATDRANIDVTVPGRSRRRVPGVDIHRSITLTERDVTLVDGIPCTTVARTQLDLADVLRRRPLERVFDQAAVLEVFDMFALEDQLNRNAARPAARRVRELLADHRSGSTATWSPLEEAFLAFTRTVGLPDPEANAWIDPGDGGPAIRVDFLWRKQRVAVEVDGYKFHSTRAPFERDRRRDQRLTVASWRPMRVTWRQITRQREELGQTFRALLNV